MYREHISNNLLNGFNPLPKLRDTRMDNTMVDYRIEIGLASLFFFSLFITLLTMHIQIARQTIQVQIISIKTHSTHSFNSKKTHLPNSKIPKNQHYQQGPV